MLFINADEDNSLDEEMALVAMLISVKKISQYSSQEGKPIGTICNSAPGSVPISKKGAKDEVKVSFVPLGWMNRPWNPLRI